MKYTVLSLFPEIIDSFFSTSIMAKAVQRELIQYRSVNIRDYAFDKHRTCDDAPYGGGAGMLLMPEPLSAALEAAGAKKNSSEKTARTIFLTPSGMLFNQDLAKELACENELILVCGRYEGIDQRVLNLYADDEISVGDYVLSSGETAALIVIDATYRLLESVITIESLTEESFSDGLLEYPQWTRPEIFDTLKVPDVLISGHHENIRHWRLEKRIEKTLDVRPDLIEKGIKAGVFNDEIIRIIGEVSERRKCERN